MKPKVMESIALGAGIFMEVPAGVRHEHDAALVDAMVERLLKSMLLVSSSFSFAVSQLRCFENGDDDPGEGATELVPIDKVPILIDCELSVHLRCGKF
jgi:hypothetical protein